MRMMDSTASLTRPENDRSALSKLSNGQSKRAQQPQAKAAIKKPGKPAAKKYTLDDLEQLSVLGRGNFGEVRLVRLKRSGELFALKQI